uniref:Zona pellucida binding protein 2 n=1 Tax=Strix occidentalis caurina TaxID=311401 RepID=A0A8D0FLP8_STROC
MRILLINRLKIWFNVYVKVFTNSPFLVCMDLARSQEEVIDPKYLWIGPDGRNLEGQMYVNLTETGKLMVMGFKESMSGAYTCTLSHKIIETMTQEEREVVEAYKFMVYVNPFAPGWVEVCHQVPYDCEDATNTRVQEAKDRIGEFFNKQAYVLKHEFQTVPTIHYVDNSFSATHIDSCRPGFGKNDLTHKNCASCCVVCDPGTYSPNNDVTCQICTRPRVKKNWKTEEQLSKRYWVCDVLSVFSCQFWNPTFIFEQSQNIITHAPQIFCIQGPLRP